MSKLEHSIFIAFILSIFLLGCSSTPKTEQDKYKEIVDSFAYKKLKTLSKNTINPSLSLYNKVKSDDDPEIKTAYVHALASTSFGLVGNSRWALAEANLAIDSADEPESKYVTYSVLSMALYNKGLMQLGDDYALKAKLIENDDLIAHKYDKNKVILSTILGLNAVKNGDGKSAELLFQSVAERREVEWLPIVAHGTAMIVENPSVFVIKDITKLMMRDDVSLEARNKLAQLRHIANENLNDPDKMKSSTGDVLQKWTLDSIKSTGTTTGEVMLDVVAKVVESILTLGHL